MFGSVQFILSSLSTIEENQFSLFIRRRIDLRNDDAPLVETTHHQICSVPNTQ